MKRKRREERQRLKLDVSKDYGIPTGRIRGKPSENECTMFTAQIEKR
jgi:hypothetical protein